MQSKLIQYVLEMIVQLSENLLEGWYSFFQQGWRAHSVCIYDMTVKVIYGNRIIILILIIQ